MKLYLDTSALVKLVQREAESEALRRYLRRERRAMRITSMLARVELVRALAAGGPGAVAHARRVFARLHLVTLDRELLDRAATLGPGVRLRSLDAIHLAAAQTAGVDLQAVVTYDDRMVDAGRLLGMPIESPA